MPKLAFTTFGVLHESWSHPQSKGFVDRVPETYASAERCDGFVDRSRRNLDNWSHSWGEVVCPRFLDPVLNEQIAMSLSVWEDVESVFAFSYADFHAEGMKQRKEWFRDPEYPNYAAWWIEDGEWPTFEVASARLEELHYNGSRPSSFNFKQPFGPDGEPYTLDQARVREKIKRNREGA